MSPAQHSKPTNGSSGRAGNRWVVGLIAGFLVVAVVAIVLAVTSGSGGGAQAGPSVSVVPTSTTRAPSTASSAASTSSSASSALSSTAASTSVPARSTTGMPTSHPSASSAPNTIGTIPPIPGGVTGPAHADPPAGTTGSPPVRVQIPAIDVSSSLQSLGIEPDGELESPSKWQVAGWYADGVRPGDTGPAIIAGHIDSVSGPAVFYNLSKLKRGDSVFVTRRNGTRLKFVVADMHEYPKKTFPTEAVYGPTPTPTLRLVTCGGQFDYSARSYYDNIVVTAYLAT